METQQVKELARLMRSYGLCRLEAKDADSYILLETEAAAVKGEAPQKSHAPTGAWKEEEPAATIEHESNDLYDQKSPLVGTLYLAPSADSPVYAPIGSMVKKGDVLCIVESLKLLNEITADIDGVVEAVCGKNEDIVEYGQTLFKLRPQ